MFVNPGREQDRSALAVLLAITRHAFHETEDHANKVELLRTPVRIVVMSKASEWLIVVGGCVFISMLGLSAYWEADIRWLHFFQAWMYVATIVLVLGRNLWGYFIGFSAAGLWIYANLFATTFFFNGLQQLSQWVRTGRLARADLLIAVPAWFANLLVVIGCVWGYFLVPARSLSDVGRLLVSFALTTGFFALDMAIFQPRYLALFPRMLQPHLPW